MRYKEIMQRLTEVNPNAIFAEGFDTALIGYTQNNPPNVAVYDAEKCISVLIDSGMPTNDAIEYLESSMKDYFRENDPIFVSL